MLHQCNGEGVTYIDPATGWVEETVAAFGERWNGVVVLVSRLEGEALPPIRPVPAPPQRAAIAATLVNAEQTLDSFIRYHLAIGFAHLYLFFDRPGDPGLRTARTYPGVTAIETGRRPGRTVADLPAVPATGGTTAPAPGPATAQRGGCRRAWPWTAGCTGCCKSTPTNCSTCPAGR
jgi:hypothetical protein